MIAKVKLHKEKLVKEKIMIYPQLIFIGVVILLITYSLPLRAGEQLSLINILELGMENNTQIKNSILDLEISDDELQLARQSLYPQIDIQSSYTRMEQGPEIPSFEMEPNLVDPESELPFTIETTTREGSRHNYNTKITIQQPLYAGGRIRLGIKQAEAGHRLTEIENSQQLNEILYQIIEAYYSVLMVRDRVEIEESALELVQEHKKLAEASVETGTSLKTDLLQAEIEETKAGQRLTEAENQLWLARKSLANLCGIDNLLELAEPTELPQLSPEQFDFEKLYRETLQYRTELKSLSLNEQLTQTNLELEEKSHYPSFYLTGNYSWQDDELSFADGTWNVTVSGSVNIFDGGKADTRKSKLEKQLVQLEESKNNFKKMIELEIKNALMEVEESETNMQMQKLNLDKAEENLQLEQKRFKAGAGRSIDVLNAQTTLKQTRVALSQAQYRYDKSLFALLYTTGGLVNYVKENINHGGKNNGK